MRVTSIDPFRSHSELRLNRVAPQPSFAHKCQEITVDFPVRLSGYKPRDTGGFLLAMTTALITNRGTLVIFFYLCISSYVHCMYTYYTIHGVRRTCVIRAFLKKSVVLQICIVRSDST